MSLRVSRLVVTPILLDEHDAIHEGKPILFEGDADGTAAEKLGSWLDELPKKLEEADDRTQ